MRLKLILFLVITFSINTFAFKLTPIVQEFGFKSKTRTKTFRIINTGKENIKLETEVFKRVIDFKSVETRPPTEDFIVYPPQVEVGPGITKALRVTYIGKETTTEEAYRLIVRQIPDKLAEKEKSKDKNQISFLFEYVASLYATPKNSKAQLKVDRSIIVSDRLEVNFQNIGNKHILLRKYKVRISQGKMTKSLSFTSKRYEKLGSLNILAGNKRRIIFPGIGSKFKSGKVQTEFLKLKD